MLFCYHPLHLDLHLHQHLTSLNNIAEHISEDDDLLEQYLFV